MPSREDLKYFQAMPLEVKIGMTKTRIREWVKEYGTDGVYVSFSGGKDSTVLLHIVRELYPNIEPVFVDTGLEYPEIRKFVKSFENVTILHPKMRFDEVIKKYGYPIISKEVAECVYGARRFLDEQLRGGTKYQYRYEKLFGKTIVKKNDTRWGGQQVSQTVQNRGVFQCADKSGKTVRTTDKRKQDTGEYP